MIRTVKMIELDQDDLIIISKTSFFRQFPDQDKLPDFTIRVNKHDFPEPDAFSVYFGYNSSKREVVICFEMEYIYLYLNSSNLGDKIIDVTWNVEDKVCRIYLV